MQFSVSLTDAEKKCFACAVSASEGNGHDFGCLDEVVTMMGGNKTAKATGALITNLQRKGLMTVHEPVQVNYDEWITQFVLTDKGFEQAGITR